MTVVSVIGGFQLFDLLFAMLGPNNPALQETQSLVYLFYNEGWVKHNQGYAAAIGVLILIIIGLVTLVQFRAQRRWVHYD